MKSIQTLAVQDVNIETPSRLNENNFEDTQLTKMTEVHHKIDFDSI